MSERSRARLLAFLLLFALPLALRVFALQHGGERGYVPDAHGVRAALGMLRDRDLVPPVGKYSVYPNLLPYLLLPVFAAQYVVGKMLGWWGGAQEFGAHLLAHPQHAAWAARGLVALFGAATTWVVFRTARAAGLRAGAWIAAWLVATGLLHVQLSQHERPWIPMTFFIAACAWGAVEHQKSGSWRALLASGACAGLALATHQGGAPALGITGLAWFLGPRSWRGADLRTRLASGFAAVLVAAVLALFLGYPARLVHGATPVGEVIGGSTVEALGGFSLGGVSIIPEIRLASFTRLGTAFVGYDPVVLGLGLLGVVLAWRVRLLRAPLVFALVWLAIFMTNRSDHARYLLPGAVLLALPAGVFAQAALERSWGKFVLVPCLALPLIQALRLDVLLARPDTRALAELELAKLPAEALVAIDRYGPEVDLDRASLVRLDKLRRSTGSELRSREANRLRELERADDWTSGVGAVRIEELFEVDVRTGLATVRKGLEPLGATPRDVLRTLGVTHVLLVDRRPRARAPSLIVDEASRGDVVLRVDPADEREEGASEAFLPSEMDFPLTGLWTVERPGPLLEVVELR